MSQVPGGNGQPNIDRSEHLSTADGENINAKRVVPYGWNGSTLERMPLGGAGLVTSAYDYVGVTYPNSTTETYTFKTGGSGGTTVATVTVVYTSASKANISSVTRT